MDILTIRHLTRYRYARAVGLGEHRMMLRPRDSFDQHVLDYSVVIKPEPVDIRYIHDVFGNSIGVVQFDQQADEVSFESFVRLEHTPECSLDDPDSPDLAKNTYPFAYEPTDLPDLYASLLSVHGDEGRAISLWARQYLEVVAKADAPHLLAALTHAIHRDFTYVARLSGPPQKPLETLRLGRGTCRDFAVLMMEAARALGLAARFVSGYLHVPPRDGGSRLGGGNTHAWVRVFLPHGGWAEYDPTNGLVGNRDLIRVAVVRDPAQATSLCGFWDGQAEDYLGMDVDVDVRVEKPGLSRLEGRT
jgi:transglutaminase-like putative cysteine protease